MTGQIRDDTPVLTGLLSFLPGAGGTGEWTEEYTQQVLTIMYDLLGLTVVNGKLCAVYGGEDE